MLRLLLVSFIAIAVSGCKSEPAASARTATLTVYTSVDEPVARPLIEEFTKRTGIAVELRTDTEATKSAGLAARIVAEKANPQADVYWGNEVFHTINLARNGCLSPYESAQAKTIPERYQDAAGHLWAGTCLRVRVIATATGAAISDRAATIGIEDLASPAYRERVGMARPTAGTTGGHVSAIYALWGVDRADTYFGKLRENGIKLLGGNSVVADMVGQGQLLVGLTDNDDVAASKRAGGQLTYHLPDQGKEQIGTLTIPCTVALVAGPKRALADDPARKLVDFLLSDEVERRLIAADFGQYSVRATGDQAIRTLDISYARIAEQMEWAPRRAIAILEGQDPKPFAPSASGNSTK